LEKWNQMEEKLGKEMDAFIMPITPTAAIRHNQFKYYGYASAINLLDFTSVVVPVTFADRELDKEVGGFKPMNDMDKQVQAECKSSTSSDRSIVLTDEQMTQKHTTVLQLPYRLWAANCRRKRRWLLLKKSEDCLATQSRHELVTINLIRYVQRTRQIKIFSNNSESVHARKKQLIQQRGSKNKNNRLSILDKTTPNTPLTPEKHSQHNSPFKFTI